MYIGMYDSRNYYSSKIVFYYVPYVYLCELIEPSFKVDGY